MSDLWHKQENWQENENYTGESKSCVCDDHGEFIKYKLAMEILKKEIWVGECPVCFDNKKWDESHRELDVNLQHRQAVMKSKGISKRMYGKTFNDYKCDTGQKTKSMDTFKKLALDIINGDSGFNIIATGSPGTGKTHLACALIEMLTDDKKSAKIISVIELMRELKDTWSRDAEFNERDIINKYASLDLLVIDEVGIQFDSETEKRFMFEVIDGRYQNVLPTVLISNMTLFEVKEIIGERVIDRLREDGGVSLVFDWKSERGRIND